MAALDKADHATKGPGTSWNLSPDLGIFLCHAAPLPSLEVHSFPMCSPTCSHADGYQPLFSVATICNPEDRPLPVISQGLGLPIQKGCSEDPTLRLVLLQCMGACLRTGHHHSPAAQHWLLTCSDIFRTLEGGR